MEMLFLKVFNMSLTATWLIAAVLLLRFMLKKTGGRIKMLLWFLLAVKLVCPFSFESEFSLVPSAEPVPPGIIYEVRPNIDSGFDSIDESVNPVIGEAFAANQQGSVNPIQVYIIIASWVWTAGMVAMFLYALVSYWQLKRKCSVSVNIYDNVYICDNIGTSFVMGFVRPKIYLDSAMEQEQADYVVRHEQAHIRRGDHWWKPLAFAVLALHCFNPFAWLCYVLFCRDIELACDEAVVSKMDITEKKNYSEALLSCSIHSARLAVCPVAFGEINVKSRIKAVLKYKKAPLWMALIAVLLCALAAVLFMTSPKKDDAVAFEAADIYALQWAEFEEYRQTDLDQLKLLEDKLSKAELMAAEPACEFSKKMYLYRSDGTLGYIEPAMDGCEVFRSGDKYYDYGVAQESGSVFSHVGLQKFRDELEYDSRGNIIKATRYRWFDLYSVTEYEYEDNYLVVQTDRNAKGEILGREERDRGENGEILESRLYIPDENGRLKLDRVCRNEYDENGYLSRAVVLNGALEVVDDNLYDYDEKGNLLVNNQLGYDKTVITYFEEEKKTVRDIYDADGNWRHAYVTYKDEMGREIRRETYEEPGVMEYWSEFEFDENGMMIHQEYWNKDGKHIVDGEIVE